jgi:hypothetical protein
MAQENDAEAVTSCKLEDFQDLAENLGAMWQLGKNARLHVVNHKGALFRSGYFLERLWNLKTCRTHRLVSPGQKSHPELGVICASSGSLRACFQRLALHRGLGIHPDDLPDMAVEIMKAPSIHKSVIHRRPGFDRARAHGRISNFIDLGFALL